MKEKEKETILYNSIIRCNTHTSYKYIYREINNDEIKNHRQEEVLTPSKQRNAVYLYPFPSFKTKSSLISRYENWYEN